MICLVNTAPYNDKESVKHVHNNNPHPHLKALSVKSEGVKKNPNLIFIFAKSQSQSRDKMDSSEEPKNDTFLEDSQSQSLLEKEHVSSFQLRTVMLMILTLISFYLFISCPFLYGSSTKASNKSTFTERNDGVMQAQPNNDFNQQHHQRYATQANDISTKLTPSQGHIDDFDNYGRNMRPNPSTDLQHLKSSGADIKVKLVQNGENQISFKKPGISCLDENGKRVSWYIAYKLPKIAASYDQLTRDGSKYYYLVPGGSWVPSQFPINSNNSVLAKTLQPLWSNDPLKDLSHILYNDQPPSKPAIVMNGHTKGLVMTSSQGGLWLQHSCPHFPDISAANFTSSYPTGGLINGQMFFCMTFGNTSIIDSIGSILQYTRPFVYNYSIPTEMDNLLPKLTKIAEKNDTVKKAPWFNIFQMETTTATDSEASLALKIFAKGPKFHREIYSSWIAPEYESSLDVQSWLNGEHPFTSNCTLDKSSVFNVLTKNISGQNFSCIDDHSKWAVGTDKDKPVVCVGDLNRMKPQKTRGGVAICLEDAEIWTAFKNIVEEVQLCSPKMFPNSSKNRFKTNYIAHR